jgi:hypothetical protein
MVDDDKIANPGAGGALIQITGVPTSVGHFLSRIKNPTKVGTLNARKLWRHTRTAWLLTMSGHAGNNASHSSKTRLTLSYLSDELLQRLA